MKAFLPFIFILVIGVVISLLRIKTIGSNRESKPVKGIILFIDQFLDFLWIIQWMGFFVLLIVIVLAFIEHQPLINTNEMPYFISTMSAFFLSVAFLFIMFFLRQFVKTLFAGNPFVEANARRLRYIAFFTIGYSVFENVTQLFRSYWISMAVQKPVQNASFSFRLDILVLGLMILVIAEVFRIGVGMREEQSLTI